MVIDDLPISVRFDPVPEKYRNRDAKFFVTFTKDPQDRSRDFKFAYNHTMYLSTVHDPEDVLGQSGGQSFSCGFNSVDTYRIFLQEMKHMVPFDKPDAVQLREAEAACAERTR